MSRRGRRGPGEGKEAQGVRVDLGENERSVHVWSGSQVGRAAEGGAALPHVNDAGVIPEDQVRVCGRGAGAKGSWTQVKPLVPPAVQLLDYDHGRAPVPQGGALPCNADAVQERAWVDAMRARLCWGDVDGAIEGVDALPPREGHAAEASRTLLGLLRNRAERLHDRSARTGGSPIGSGGIESAHTCLRHVRRKRAGAWWSLEQAHHRLALRGAIDHGTCASVFEASTRRTLQRHGGNPP